MIKSFFHDTSGFKRRIFLMLFCSFALLFFSSILFQSYGKLSKQNETKRATYYAENKWVQSFDYETAENLEKILLKPVAEAEIDEVQKKQLAILRKAGIKILTAKEDVPVKNSTGLNHVKHILILEGAWDSFVKALNEFETQNLVVITSFEMVPKDNKTLKANVEYNIYFM